MSRPQGAGGCKEQTCKGLQWVKFELSLSHMRDGAGPEMENWTRDGNWTAGWTAGSPGMYVGWYR